MYKPEYITIKGWWWKKFFKKYRNEAEELDNSLGKVIEHNPLEDADFRYAFIQDEYNNKEYFAEKNEDGELEITEEL